MQISGWSLFCISVTNILVIFENWSQSLWNRGWRSQNKWKRFCRNKRWVGSCNITDSNKHKWPSRISPKMPGWAKYSRTHLEPCLKWDWDHHTNMSRAHNPWQSIKDLGTNPLCLGNVDQRQPIWPEPCPGQPPWWQPCWRSSDRFVVANCYWVVDHLGVVHHHGVVHHLSVVRHHDDHGVSGFHCFPPCADQTLTSVAQYWFSTPESQHYSQRLFFRLNPMILRQKVDKKRKRR